MLDSRCGQNGKGFTGALPDSGRLTVWVLDSRCGWNGGGPTGMVGRGIGWEYDLVYGEGLTGVSLDNGGVVV